MDIDLSDEEIAERLKRLTGGSGRKNSSRF